MPPISYMIQIQPPDKTPPALLGSLLETIKERITNILADSAWENCKGLRVRYRQLDLSTPNEWNEGWWIHEDDATEAQTNRTDPYPNNPRLAHHSNHRYPTSASDGTSDHDKEEAQPVKPQHEKENCDWSGEDTARTRIAISRQPQAGSAIDDWLSNIPPAYHGIHPVRHSRRVSQSPPNIQERLDIQAGKTPQTTSADNMSPERTPSQTVTSDPEQLPPPKRIAPLLDRPCSVLPTRHPSLEMSDTPSSTMLYAGHLLNSFGQ